MLAQPHIAKTFLSDFLQRCSRWPKALRDWFREAQREREARGRRLLTEWLSPEQWAQYEANGYFDVSGCDTGKRYRIRHGIVTNVYELNEAGQPRTGWCFVPEGSLVAGDVVLAQKIALETDERGALAVANTFEISRSLSSGLSGDRGRCEGH
jgi:hypothetical protein